MSPNVTYGIHSGKGQTHSIEAHIGSNPYQPSNLRINLLCLVMEEFQWPTKGDHFKTPRLFCTCSQSQLRRKEKEKESKINMERKVVFLVLMLKHIMLHLKSERKRRIAKESKLNFLSETFCRSNACFHVLRSPSKKVKKQMDRKRKRVHSFLI